MFQVGRYDPGQDERDKKSTAKKAQEEQRVKKQKKSGKRKQIADGQRTSSSEETLSKRHALNDEAGDGTLGKSSLYVIAREPKDESNKKPKLLGVPDEAFDDLEIVDDLLETTDDNNKEPLAEAASADLPSEIRTALQMSSLPIKEAAEVWKLAPFLVENLLRDGYQTFFPIQCLVIPDVIASERHSHIRVRDVCVAAPTGSGKTLAFVIPILNSLASRQVKRLRALVVLPSRDLGKFASFNLTEFSDVVYYHLTRQLSIASLRRV